ncbi:hypothetical protein ACVKU6_004547, partial [Stenotrophomonas sp. PvP086]
PCANRSVGADLGRHPPNPGGVGDPDPAQADLIVW